jgi:hypothetical protein
MKLTGAMIASLLLRTLTACGAAETPARDEMVGSTDTAASSLSSDCTGLVPGAIPSGFTKALNFATGCSPLGGTSDGLGNYNVGLTCDSNEGFESWRLVDGNGAFRGGAFELRRTFIQDNERIERHVLPQRNGGFLAFHWTTEPSSLGFHRLVALRAYDGNGMQTGEHLFIDLTAATRDSFPDRSWSMAPVISGGAQVTHVSLPGDGTWHLSTQRYSPNAVPLQGVQQLATASNLSITPHLTLTGVATGGQALIAWDNGTQGRAVWTDSTGRLVSGTFALPFRIDGSTSLSPLLDGTLAFNHAGGWVGTLAPGGRSVAPPPSWLSTHPGTRLFLVRGGRAHALIQQQTTGSCPAHVVLFAAAGNRCGAIDLPSGDANGCAFTGDVGADGTVIVLGRTQLSASVDFPLSVTQRFYPQLLR